MHPLGSISSGIPAQSSPAALAVKTAEGQHGVISRRQLIAAGMAPSTIADWVKIGHLHRVHRGVYAIGRPNLTREGLWMAAILACGHGAGLFGGSTAQHFGLMPFSPGAIHIALPRLVRRSPRGILVHRPRGLEPIDLTKRLGIPTTTATRALFDLAPSLTANALRTAFDQAAYLHLLNRPRLHALLTGATGTRGLGTLRALLAEVPLPLSETRSHLERLSLFICREHGLPIPGVNVPLLGYEVDLHWPAARFVVEADGGRHVGRRRDRDNQKDVTLARAGILVRRYSGKALEDEDAVAGEILDIVRERMPTN